MKNSKNIAFVFFGIALLSLCVMCVRITSAVVSYAWIIKQAGNINDVPFYFAFLTGIPFLLAIITSLVIASILWKKSKQVSV